MNHAALEAAMNRWGSFINLITPAIEEGDDIYALTPKFEMLRRPPGPKGTVDEVWLVKSGVEGQAYKLEAFGPHNPNLTLAQALKGTSMDFDYLVTYQHHALLPGAGRDFYRQIVVYEAKNWRILIGKAL